MNNPEPVLRSSLAWGRRKVSLGGQDLSFRDGVLRPGGATGWNWKATGSNHRSRIRPANLSELLEKDVEISVAGCGFPPGYLSGSRSASDLARDRIPRSGHKKAVALYNGLACQGRRVTAIFHLNC